MTKKQQVKTHAQSMTLDALTLKRALPFVKPTQSRRALSPGLHVTENAGFAALTGWTRDLEISINLPDPWTEFNGRLVFQPLYNFVKACRTGETLTLTRVADDYVEIKTGSTTLTILPDSYEERPRLIKERPNHCNVLLDTNAFLSSLDLVKCAMSNEHTRYYLNGIYIHAHESDPTGLVFVATNGHQLVSHTLTGVTHTLDPAEPSLDSRKGFLIPRDTIAALYPLLKAFPSAQAEFAFIEKNLLTITTPDFTLGTQLIDGTFPDYKRVIPKNTNYCCTIDAASLHQFITRSVALSSKNNCLIKIESVKDSREIKLSHTVSGNCINTLFTGHCQTNLEIGFNSKYLLQAMGILKTPKIRLFANDSLGPAIFCGPEELADPATILVIMPARV